MALEMIANQLRSWGGFKKSDCSSGSIGMPPPGVGNRSFSRFARWESRRRVRRESRMCPLFSLLFGYETIPLIARGMICVSPQL